MATTFSLAGQGLKLDTKEDLLKHISPLQNSEDVKSIDLSGNTFGVEACKALAPVLSKQSKLQSIDLHDIFTSRSLAEIPPALTFLLNALLACSNLQTVDLSDNAFGLNTKDPLVDFLSKHVPLKHLILNNNGMGPIAGSMIADALTTLANRKQEAKRSGADVPDLESIVCGRNRLENGSMASWAKAYSAHKSGIKSVKMTQNGIRPEGISELLRFGLLFCQQLEILDMQDNTFTYRGAFALSQSLSGWSQLKELGVGDDLLGGRGSIKVFEELARGHNLKIEVLRLQYNDINASGVKALLSAAKEGLPALRRVELNGNKFEEDDSHLEELVSILSERKDEKGQDTDPDGFWGVDELDELEGEDSEDENGDDEDEDDDDDEVNIETREKMIKDVDQAEDAAVLQKEDIDVDDLAAALAKTRV